MTAEHARDRAARGAGARPVAVGLYSFTIAWILAKIIDKTMGFRVPEEDEVTGVDITQHAETAYDLGSIHTVHTASGAVTSAASPGGGVTNAGQEAAVPAKQVTGAR